MCRLNWCGLQLVETLVVRIRRPSSSSRGFKPGVTDNEAESTQGRSCDGHRWLRTVKTLRRDLLGGAITRLGAAGLITR